MNSRILLVEDEAALAEIVKEVLEGKGLEIYHAHDVAHALRLVSTMTFDLLILDVMLPDGDGYQLLRHIRRQGINSPALFLTSKSLPADVVEGFESGANDYLKKPFGMEELIIRIKALLGLLHQSPTSEKEKAMELCIGEYIFHYPQGWLIRHGSSRKLTFREAEILWFLCARKSHIIPRKEMLIRFWGNDDYFSGRSLDVFITKLRKYLQADPSISILNFRGQGYKLIY